MGKVASFTLPVPPSVNHYYVRNRYNGKVIIGKAGKLYRLAVVAALSKFQFQLSGRLAVEIILCGKMDLDNINKCLLDALRHAKVYADDGQIDDLRILRSHDESGKEFVEVQVREIQA